MWNFKYLFPFFSLKDWVSETQLRIEFLTPNAGVWNQLHKTLTVTFYHYAGQQRRRKTTLHFSFLLIPTNRHWEINLVITVVNSALNAVGCWGHIQDPVNVYETLCVTWYHLYNLKYVKNNHRGVLLLVKFHAEDGNFTKSNLPPWMFF